MQTTSSSFNNRSQVSEPSSPYLYYFPVATIIMPKISSSNIQQKSNTSLIRPRSTESEKRESASSSDSSGANSINNRSIDFNCILDLREMFLKFVESQVNSTSTIYKLYFLDEFYDNVKGGVRKFESLEEMFGLCDKFLCNLVSEVESLKEFRNSLNVSLKFPYLQNIDALESKRSEIPLLDSHELTLKWFKTQSELASQFLQQQKETLALGNNEIKGEVTTSSSNESTAPQGNILENDFSFLKTLTSIFSRNLEDLFSYWQKHNKSIFKKWFTKNAQILPNYVIQIVQKNRKRFLQYHDTFKLTEEDLNVTTLIDSDFDFAHYLCEHTEDWKIAFDNMPSLIMYKSKESYTTIASMNLQKNITYLPYSIENVAKSVLTNNIGQNNGMFSDTKYQAYQELNPNDSTRKNSTVVQTGIWNGAKGVMVRNRYFEHIISTRAVMQDNEVVEIIHLFKTCSYISQASTDKKAPVKMIVFGCRKFQKDDVDRTRIVESRLFSMGGLLDNSFLANVLAAKPITTEFVGVLNNQLSENAKLGFPNPDPAEHVIWRTLVDYCRYHYNIDITKW